MGLEFVADGTRRRRREPDRRFKAVSVSSSYLVRLKPRLNRRGFAAEAGAGGGMSLRLANGNSLFREQRGIPGQRRRVSPTTCDGMTLRN